MIQCKKAIINNSKGSLKNPVTERRFLLLLVVFLFPFSIKVKAQDTVRVSLNEFIKLGLQYSAQLKAQQNDVDLAKNKVYDIKAHRFLPEFELTTRHALVPGVKSDSILSNGKPLPRDQYYLDPNLKNDWSKWSIYSDVEIHGIQPIFTWGAIDNAVNAARQGAEAAEQQFLSQKSKVAEKLYQLYYSRVLALQMQHLLSDAQQEFNKANKKIKQMQDSASADLDDADVYKFKIYHAEFDIKATQVNENTRYVTRIWNMVLNADTNRTVYLPKDQFLDAVTNKIRPFTYYQVQAIENRPEIKALKAAESAADFGLKAKKAELFPTLYVGLGADYTYSPRPTNSKPEFGNRYSYLNLFYAFGIRQNLNFLTIKSDIQQTKLQYEKLKYSRDAVVQGINVELDDAYKNAIVSQTTMQKMGDALETSKKWLREEQINYDLGVGKVKDLLDAVKTNLELEASYRQKIFEYNLDMAKLYNVSGMPLIKLNNTHK